MTTIKNNQIALGTSLVPVVLFCLGMAGWSAGYTYMALLGAPAIITTILAAETLNIDLTGPSLLPFLAAAWLQFLGIGCIIQLLVKKNKENNKKIDTYFNQHNDSSE